MTREEFVKKRFLAYQSIDYKNQRTEEELEMMLVGIDFDNEVLVLVPFDSENYETDRVHIPIEFCDITKPKPKMIYKKKMDADDSEYNSAS